MLHEDRILKSIDLLTYNAREVLNKFSIWASTSDSDVEFDLFDALPSYTNNGTTGDGEYLKPLTVPSFSSISSGIFGTLGTTSTRDIYWNFDFVSNGVGWYFDEYVATTGNVAKSTTTPKLHINVSSIYDKSSSGNDNSIIIRHNTLSYVEGTTNINLTSDLILEKANNINLTGTTAIGINSNKISIGNSISTGTITNYAGEYLLYTKIDGIKTNLIDFSTSLLTLGNIGIDFILNAKDINFHFAEGFLLSQNDDNGFDLLGYDNDTETSYFADGGKYAYAGNDSEKLGSSVKEGFSFFVKNSSTDDTSAFDKFFDVWVEGGVDKYYVSTRDTNTYSDFNTSIPDNLKKSQSSSIPYYLNIGTNGTLTLDGEDLLTVKSANEIDFNIGSSSEIVVKKGAVSIPNLELPIYTKTNLSDIKRYYDVNNQIKAFRLSKINNSTSFNGNDVCTKITNDFNVLAAHEKYIWTTFNSDTTTVYEYVYYFESTSTANEYNLICETYSYLIGRTPNYATPLYKTTISTFYTDITNVQATSDSGQINTYFFISDVQGVTVCSSNDRGNSFTVTLNKFKYKNNLTLDKVISINTSITSENLSGCGIKDSIWLKIESTTTNVDPEFNQCVDISIYNYDEYENEILSIDLPNYFATTSSYSYTYTTRKISNPPEIASLGAYYNGTTFGSILLISTNTHMQRKSNDYNIGLLFNISISNHALILTSGTRIWNNADPGLAIIEGGGTSQYYSYANKLNVIYSSANGFKIYTYFNVYNIKTKAYYFFGSALYSTTDFSTITPTYGTLGSILSNSVVSENSGFIYDSGSTSYLYKTNTGVAHLNDNTSIPEFEIFTLITNTTITNINLTITGLNVSNYTNTYVLNNQTIAVINNSTLILAYSSTATGSVTYNSLVTSTKVVTVVNSIINKYNDYISASYIDVIGLDNQGYTSYNAILSNEVSTKYSYKINSYKLTTNNSDESISVNTGNDSEIVEVSALILDSNGNDFSQIVVSNDTISTDNTVALNLCLEDNVVDNSAANLPISLICFNGNAVANISRKSGALIKITSPNNLSNINNSYLGRFSVPIEALSLFTKRAYASNTTLINRNDFTITFESVGISVDNSANFVFATFDWNTVYANSGHCEKFLLDSNFETNYQVNDGLYTDDNYKYGHYILVYDKTYNRTYVLTNVSTNGTPTTVLNKTFLYNNLISFNANNLLISKGGSFNVVSIDSSLLNPSDSNFNNYLSIINEKSNVTSIRCDYFEGFSQNTVIASTTENQSSIILGFTEINNQEVGC
ncbi:MAG: hypothetical protein M0R17_00495 [Candidatus Omnitrophica bacterium]|jgi:hypothetical protein|nr:hypothetical protein [Candidatus Omnitrophota bacterium]